MFKKYLKYNKDNNSRLISKLRLDIFLGVNPSQDLRVYFHHHSRKKPHAYKHRDTSCIKTNSRAFTRTVSGCQCSNERQPKTIKKSYETDYYDTLYCGIRHQRSHFRFRLLFHFPAGFKFRQCKNLTGPEDITQLGACSVFDKGQLTLVYYFVDSSQY